MAPFIFPSSLHELEEDLNGCESRICVETVTDLSFLRAVDLEEFVKGLAFDLSDREIVCVEEQGVFDRVYSLAKGFRRLPPSCKSILVETLRSNLSVLLPGIDSLARSTSLSPRRTAGLASPPSNGFTDTAERLASHRNALKIYTFFLFTIVLSEESESSAQELGNAPPGGVSKSAAHGRRRNASPASTWNFGLQRSRVINVIANSLDINLPLLFGSPDADEKFLSFISKCALLLFENSSCLKDDETRDGLCRIIGAISTKYHRTTEISASILNLVHKFEFSVSPLANAVASAEKKYSDGSLLIALIREIGQTDPKDFVRDTTGAENVGSFLVELAGLSPKIMSTNIGILIPHFGGESYKIRNALIGVLGRLVAKAFNDIEGDASSKSLRLRGKQALLNILLERARDVSAYTRSRVLQVWADLCEEHAVSIGLWNEVAAMAAGRLEDKSAFVRKSALTLLITMLQHNPFGPELRIVAFEATLQKYKEILCEMEPRGNNPSPMAEVTEDTSMPVGDLEQTRALVASLESGLEFSRCLSSAMNTLVQLLASASVSDVENTILLLMRCKQFQIDGAEACLRKMLPLVFSRDKSIHEAVENAFISIYIRKSPSETAFNLLKLESDSNLGDLAALEFIIGSLVCKGEISMSTMSALWDIFCFNVNGVTASQCRGSLSLLCMAAKASPGVLSSHLLDIIDIGFGRWAKDEPLLARTACVALERLSNEDIEKLRKTCGTRVFGTLKGLITGFVLPESIWYAAANKAISVIYSIHPAPEMLAADLVKSSLRAIFLSAKDKIDSETLPLGESNLLVNVSASKLSRCLFIISHVALNQLVYIESCVRNIHKQRASKEKSKLNNEYAGDDEAASEGNSKDSINVELGLASSRDAMIDGLAERAEKEIISGSRDTKNLIGLCGPFVSKLCRNYTLIQKYPELQASAMLALCRLMIIDAQFCEKNLQLLFTVIDGSPSETVRSNCTLALGDLAARFPNILEPWTENMYARLRDPVDSVRKNAVLVLSHLILNDMMKVKGYINEMAMKLEDENERISSLSKLFFHQLSKKGNNPIYNLLPDILSRLSRENLKPEKFRSIMQFLINSIKKDKQMEGLIDKLCNRFAGVYDARQLEYISYCLSQLTFTERGFKKLIESLKTYGHALSEDSVVEHFRHIISKGKKFAKPDLKTCIEEFEARLNQIQADRKEQEKTTQNAAVYQQQIDTKKGLVSSNQSTDADGCESSDDVEPGEDATDTCSQSCVEDESKSQITHLTTGSMESTAENSSSPPSKIANGIPPKIKEELEV
ncbi:binding protein isoform X2 [Wolffia australiana]